MQRKRGEAGFSDPKCDLGISIEQHSPVQSLEALEQRQRALVWLPVPCFHLHDADGISLLQRGVMLVPGVFLC